jgi:hypothetical protein
MTPKNETSATPKLPSAPLRRLSTTERRQAEFAKAANWQSQLKAEAAERRARREQSS